MNSFSRGRGVLFTHKPLNPLPLNEMNRMNKYILRWTEKEREWKVPVCKTRDGNGARLDGCTFVCSLCSPGQKTPVSGWEHRAFPANKTREQICAVCSLRGFLFALVRLPA